MAYWEEYLHPRAPEGMPTGGRFVEKGGSDKSLTSTRADIRAKVIAVQQALSDELRRPPWQGTDNPYAGHCYVASEALYHLLGGKAGGYRPMYIRHEGSPHWFLKDTKGNVVDPTASQFRTAVPYDDAIGKGFLTDKPSKRAQIVLDRVQGKTVISDEGIRPREAIVAYKIFEVDENNNPYALYLDKDNKNVRHPAPLKKWLPAENKSAQANRNNLSDKYPGWHAITKPSAWWLRDKTGPRAGMMRDTRRWFMVKLPKTQLDQKEGIPQGGYYVKKAKDGVLVAGSMLIDHMMSDEEVYRTLINQGVSDDEARRELIDKNFDKRVSIADEGIAGTPANYLPSTISLQEVERQARANVQAGIAAATAEGVTPLKNSKGHPYEVSERNPSAVGAVGDPTVEYMRSDLEGMKLDTEQFAINMGLLDNANFYPFFREDELSNDLNARATTFIGKAKSNLKLIYNLVPKAIRDRAAIWYQGANRLANRTFKMADGSIYKYPDYVTAGAYAALSASKEWFENVYIANAALEIYATKQDAVWDDVLDRQTRTTWAGEGFAHERQVIRESMRGLKLSQLTTPEQKAIFIRTYNEAHSDRSYQVLSPEGEAIRTVVNQDGTNATAAWGTTNKLADVVRIIESQREPDIQKRRKIISDALGTRHKVRNFYNNILNPFSENRSWTSDTHNVGAAFFFPSTQNSVSVCHMLSTSPKANQLPLMKLLGYKGSSARKIHGSSGLYGLYADAGRDAARDLGLLPNQLQAITWTGKISIFSPLSPSERESVMETWMNYHDGGISWHAAEFDIRQRAPFRWPDWATR